MACHVDLLVVGNDVYITIHSSGYAAGKFAVGYGLPGRDGQEFQIDFLLELGDFFAGYDSVAEGWHGV